MPPPPPAPTSEPVSAPTSTSGFRSLLNAVRRHQRRQLWTQGALWALATLALMLLLGGLAGSVSPGLGKVLFLFAPVAAAAVLCVFCVVLSVRWVGDDRRTARLVGRRVRGLDDSMLSAVELEHALETEPASFSSDLAREFLKRTDERASSIQPTDVVDARWTQRAGMGLVAALLIVGLISLFQGSRWMTGARAALKSVAVTGELAHREPITGDVELTYRYPAYTGLAPRVVAGTSGEIAAPAGTVISLKSRSDREVERAELTVNGKSLPLQVRNARELEGQLVVDQPGTYSFRFLNARGREVARGQDIPITVQADELPKVILTAPADELEVDPNQRVILKFSASDDYGLTSLELSFKTSRQPELQTVPLKLGDERRYKGQYSWDLAPFKLRPGERVSYFLQAKDNDEVQGKKSGVSATQVLKVYSASEHRREAVARAEALWERMVGHLGDRLEGPDRAEEKELDKISAAQPVDRAGQELVSDLGAAAREIARDKDSPQELWMALANISESMQSKVRATSEFRRLYLRYMRDRGVDMEFGKRLTRVVEDEVRDNEKNVLYLESLLDRQKLQDLKDLGKQLAEQRRELTSLVEEYRKTQDPKLQESILSEISALKDRINELMQRMGELAKGIRDEHLNAEALKEMMQEQDMSSSLDDIERLMREGKTDEALTKLQQMAQQMEEMLKNFDSAEDDMGQEQYPELAEKFQDFMEKLKDTTARQEQLASQSKEIRDRYKSQLKDRLQQRGQQLKDQLLKAVEDVSRDYANLQPDQLNSRADKPLEELESELANLRNALKVDDFDLAAESAERAERASAELSGFGQQQKQLDEVFQNPPDIRQQSKQLAEKLNRDAEKVADVNRKLQQLFPQPGSNLSEQDRARMKQMGAEQRRLEQRAHELQQKMDEMAQMAPLFGEEASQQMDEVAERMGEASQRMDARDPGRGYSEQKAAMDQLQQLQKQMQQSKSGSGKGRGLPMPMYAGSRSQGWSSQHEKVEIPDADQYQAPKEFRKDLLDAMKQGAPDKYKDQVKRYYEELVK
ncbi:MAG: DUF4175 family protein [Myxococcaceae bacterium]